MLGAWYDFLFPALPAMREEASASADLVAASSEGARAQVQAEIEDQAKKRAYEGAFAGAAVVVGAGVLLWLMLRR